MFYDLFINAENFILFLMPIILLLYKVACLMKALNLNCPCHLGTVNSAIAFAYIADKLYSFFARTVNSPIAFAYIADRQTL